MLDESPDYATYETYKEPNQDIDAWREQNINQLVYRLSRTLHQYDVESEKVLLLELAHLEFGPQLKEPEEKDRILHGAVIFTQ